MIWIILASIIASISPEHWTWPHIISWSILNVFIYAVLANINMLVLFPRFLQRNSIILYTASLLGICLLATPLIVLLNRFFCNLENGLCYPWIISSKLHFISLMIVTSLSTLVRLPIEWIKVQNDKRILQTKNVQAELQFLKNQVNPHFLFNTLNNLYALTLKKSDQAPELILKLSDMLRYMLYECNEAEVPLSKEIHYISNYLDLEKIRLSKMADIRMVVDGDPSTFKVAPLLFIPFIENSFKHGLKFGDNAAYIHILFKIDHELRISITNSKPSAAPGIGSVRSVGGIGLANVRKRLDLIYPKRYELIIQDNPDQYSIQLKILK